jgi:hypothetical protein
LQGALRGGILDLTKAAKEEHPRSGLLRLSQNRTEPKDPPPGKQNILEGSQAGGTSKKTELTPTHEHSNRAVFCALAP